MKECPRILRNAKKKLSKIFPGGSRTGRDSKSFEGRERERERKERGNTTRDKSISFTLMGFALAERRRRREKRCLFCELRSKISWERM